MSGFLDLNPFLLLSLVVAVVTISRAVYNVYFHPLARFPGPFLAKITPLYDLWWFLWGEGGNSGMEEHLLNTYGPVVRKQPNTLIFNDARMLPVIYNRYAEKGPAYYWFHVTMGILGIRSHQEHAARRKLIASPFNNSAVQAMRPLVQNLVDEWIAGLGELADAGKPFDATHWGEYLTYDIISELAFGEPLGFIKNRRDYGNLIEGFHGGLIEIGVFMRLPSLAKFLNKCGLIPLFRRLCLTATNDSKGLEVVLAERDRLVELRSSQGASGQKQDILAHLLSASKDPSQERHLTLEEIKADTFLFMVAGSDTTGSFFRTFLIELATHPELYAELMKTEFATKRSKEKPGLANRPLLSACVKETLRLYPPSTVPFPRFIPAEGVHLPNGGFIPGGVEVAASMLSVNRDKNMFGEDADRWVPDRWIRDGPAKAAEMEKHLYTFGYGARICLGKPIAELEIELAIPQLLEAFHVELPRPEKPFESYNNFGIVVHEGVWLTLKRR